MAGERIEKRILLKKLNRLSKYQIIRENAEYGIQWLCAFLGVNRAAYYKWIKREASRREIENIRVLERIREVAESNNSLFGSVSMTYYLNNHRKPNDIHVNHKRVSRLMCIHGIYSQRPRYRVGTYVRSTPEETAENLLKRDFTAHRPNEKWCTDVTEDHYYNPKTRKTEKVYISTILDLYDRTPVSVVLSTRNDTVLVNQTLEKAIRNNPDAHPLFHSDRGFQYTRRVFSKQLETLGMIQSMSRVHRCIDNGPMEGFQGILKELLHVLTPIIQSYEEYEVALNKAKTYYLEEYPQLRFKGKTAGQVRSEALLSEEPLQYPLLKNYQCIKFWKNIEDLKTNTQLTN